MHAQEVKVYYAADTPAQFPGGVVKLMEYMSSHLHYPDSAMVKNVQGKCVVQFAVRSNGEVGEVKVLHSLSPECDAEAVRVVRSLPKFMPGKINGEPVAVWYTLPVQFKLQKPIPLMQEPSEERLTFKNKLPVEKKFPVFPGGDKALMEYISRNLEYPKMASTHNIHGKCVVQFVVTETGGIDSIRVVKPINPLLDAAVIRVIMSLPKFTPGTCNGVPVRVRYTLPVTFAIKADAREPEFDPTDPRNIDPGFSM